MVKTIHLPDDLHKKLKVYASINDTTIEKVASEVLNDYFEEEEIEKILRITDNLEDID